MLEGIIWSLLKFRFIFFSCLRELKLGGRLVRLLFCS